MADEDTLIELDDMDGDGEEPSAEALAELAALAEADRAVDIEVAGELAGARRALDEQRALTAAAVARYREAMLRAEPDLPPELVSGDSIDAVDASLAAARRTVAQIRSRLAAEAEPPRGFPTGSPARGEPSADGLSAAEKIAYGLQQRARE